MKIYTIVLDAKKSTCCRYNSGKKRTTSSEIPYFYVECRLLDFNERVFDKVSTTLGIGKFQGAKRVDRFEAFPFEFHAHQKEMREYFVKCDRQFVFLTNQHHVRYRSNVFYIEKGEYVEVLVNNRIMIDVASFRKINPNYIRSHINELTRSSSSIDIYIFFSNDIKAKEVKTNDLNTIVMSEGDLIICSQTIYEWSFGNKR